jgi:hypothetical protein
MRSGRDVRVDPEADRRFQPERGRDAAQHLGFLDRFEVELEEPSFERQLHLLLSLADPGEDDPVARNAGGAGAAIFAARDDVRTQPPACQGREHGRVGIGLDRIGDQRIGQGLERGPEHVDVPDHGRGRIDVDRRPDRRRDRGQRHVLAMDDPVSKLEMVHLSRGANWRRDDVHGRFALGKRAGPC